MNKTFEVEMVERGFDGKIRTINQTAIVPSRAEVIKIFGLDQPDIIRYKITEVE